jgi:hypothetical protein
MPEIAAIGRLAVIARGAPQPGTRSLCARIRSQLEAWAELREARIQISARGTLLNWSDEVRAKPDALADAARAIERSIQIDSHWGE